MRRSVCLVHCGKTADRIRMPFGIIGRTGPGTRQVVGFGDRFTGRGTFGGEFWARYCNQWGLYGVRVRQRRDAALFSNHFGQTCFLLRSIAISLPVCLSVRLSVCLSVCEHISGTARPIFIKFLCRYPAAVARCSASDVAICYGWRHVWP